MLHANYGASRRGGRLGLGRPTQIPAGLGGGLLDPGGELDFIELVAFVDVDPAGFFAAFGVARWGWVQCGAAEERYLYVAGEDVEGEEPVFAVGAVKGRVPFDGLGDAGDVACDERVDALADSALPAWHGGDVGLDGGVAFCLGDLWIAAGEQNLLLCRTHPLRI